MERIDPSPAIPAEPAPASSSSSSGSFDFDDVVATVQSLPAADSAAPKERPVQLAEASLPKTPAARPAAAKPAPEKKPEPARPKEPSRFWVQLAVAQDKSAFPGEFRRLKGKVPDLLSGKSAWTAPMGRTNRLLVGPFKTEKEARLFVNQLSKAEISSFSWVSDEGQKVDKLPAK
jgi:cell division septation protein DedD